MNTKQMMLGVALMGGWGRCFGAATYPERPDVAAMAESVGLASWCSRAENERQQILSTSEGGLLPWEGAQTALVQVLKSSLSTLVTNFVDIRQASNGNFNAWFADESNTSFPFWSAPEMLDHLSLSNNFYEVTALRGGRPELGEWTAIRSHYAELRWTSSKDSYWRIVEKQITMQSDFAFVTNHNLTAGQFEAFDKAFASAERQIETNLLYQSADSYILASSSHRGCVWNFVDDIAAKYEGASQELRAYPGVIKPTIHFACEVEAYLRSVSACVQDDIFSFTNYPHYCRPQLTGDLSGFTNPCIVYSNMAGYTNAFVSVGSGQSVYYGDGAPPLNTFCDNYLLISSESVSYDSIKSTFISDYECATNSTDSLPAFLWQTVGLCNCWFSCPPEEYMEPDGEYSLSLEVAKEHAYELIHLLKWDVVEDECIVYY